MFKKTVSVILSLIMLFGVIGAVPIQISAEEVEIEDIGATSGTTGDCTWTLDDNGVLTISGNGAMGDYSDTYSSSQDIYITTAPWGANIKSVDIENGVTSIGSYAFDGCTGLTSVTFSNSVTSIGEFAFFGCIGLSSIDIPDSVTNIGSDAFHNCTGLTSVTIGNSVTSIDDWAFSGCSGLTSIEIPDSVTNIGAHALSDTAWYDNQPDGLVYAGKVAYKMIGACPDHVEIKDGTTGIAGEAFRYCWMLTSIEIPDSVTSIGENAFERCPKLTSIEIPDSVTNIGDSAFEECTELTSIEIPDSVTSIGSNAFFNTAWYDNQPDGLIYAGKVAYVVKGECPAEVAIKESTLGIADSAFFGCSDLTSVTIPNSVTTIGDSSFSYCYNLSSINVDSNNPAYRSIDGNLYDKSAKTFIQYSIGKVETSFSIPDSVTTISVSAFSSCSLTSVNTGNSVKTINENAFSSCKNLTSVTLGKSITSFNYDTFSDCDSLTDIMVDSNNASYCSIDGNLYNKSATTFVRYALGKAATHFSIPDSVKTIAEGAFYRCLNLTSVTIPNSVTSIEQKAFDFCHVLTSVTIGNSVKTIGMNAFRDCPLTTVTIPNSVTDIGAWAFYGCTRLTSASIGNSVTTIGKSAFFHCINLKSVSIPVSVSIIGRCAFGYYPSNGYELKLDDFTIYGYKGTAAETYANDNSFAFVSLDATEPVVTNPDYEYRVLDDGTAEITGYKGNGGDITIPSTLDGYTVTSIGNWAFEDCIGLTSIDIPDSVTAIGRYAFYGCTGLTSIDIPDSVTTVCDNVIYGCTNIVSITVSKNNPVYDSRDNCNAIIDTKNNILVRGCKNTVIPNSVTSIGNSAFSGCAGLTSIEIPNSVTSIGDWAFEDCTGLTSVEIPNSVTSIGDYVFYKCTGLISIDIPNSVMSIGNSAFSGCAGLTSIEIPNSVTSIGVSAFDGCTNLTNVAIPDSVTRIGDKAFGYYYDSEYKLLPGFTIYGYENTAAEAYANQNGFKFIALNEEPEVIGDSDGDGKLTPIDVTNIQFYLSSMDYEGTEDIMMFADVDKNGRIETIDATFIQRYLAGIEIPYEIG